MLKRSLLLGLVAGIVAGLASTTYTQIYNSSLGTDFSAIAKPGGVFLSSIIGCLLASLGYMLVQKIMNKKGDFIFNLLFMVLSLATIMGPFGAKLPLTAQMPELFPGLTVPMHLFPALAWMTFKPLFFKAENKA